MYNVGLLDYIKTQIKLLWYLPLSVTCARGRMAAFMDSVGLSLPSAMVVVVFFPFAMLLAIL